MEPAYDNRPLFQHQCYLPCYRRFQCHIGLCDLDPSHAVRLEVAHATEKENPHDHDLRNRALVGDSLLINLLSECADFLMFL